MNPRIPADYHEIGDWLASFARSHAKREDARTEVMLATEERHDRRSYGVRLTLGARVHPPLDAPPIELEFSEVVEGRTRFAWCEALGARIRAAARELLDATAA
jgi:hypothetical protein